MKKPLSYGWLALGAAVFANACGNPSVPQDTGADTGRTDVTRADSVVVDDLTDPTDDVEDPIDDAPPDPIDDFPPDPDDASDDALTPPDGSADAGPPPVPLATPIRYLVIITKENHTFDNMF